jgi:hypothetical protein
MKQKKIKPKPAAYEYLLTVSQKYDEIKNKYLTLIRLQTVQEFTNFKYELAVEEVLEKNKIRYKLLGINTPKLLIPGGGPAVYEKTYEQLAGEHEIEVMNLDGEINFFKIKLLKNKILLLKEQQKSFIDILCIQNYLK